MKKLFICGIISLLLLICLSSVAAADTVADFSGDYAVFLTGPDKSSGVSTLDMDGSSYITGNVIMQSGTYYINPWWGDFIRGGGKVYPNTGVAPSSKVGTGLSNLLGKGIIAEEGIYTVQDPIVFENGLPELEEKGALDVTNTEVTVSESGWYSNIEIGGNPNKLTFDVSDGKILHIRADSISVNGTINIIGDGKVYLYTEGFNFGGKVYINENGDNEQLYIYINGQSGQTTLFNGTIRMAANIYVPSGNVEMTGNVVLNGHIYVADSFKNENGTVIINGLVYAPNSDVVMYGTNEINGALIARTLQIYGSARINKGEVAGAGFRFPQVDTAPPEEDDNYVNGVLGHYYDASGFDNESALRLIRIDSNIAFNFMYDSPHEVIDEETFAIKWEGYLRPSVSGNYIFKTYSDDGIIVNVNNQEIINTWGLLSLDYSIAQNPVYLEAGEYYPITVEYQQIPLYAAVFLFWEAEEVPMQLVPESAFYITQQTQDNFSEPVFLNVVSKTGEGLLNTFYTLDGEGQVEEEYTEVNNINYIWGSDSPTGLSGDAFYGVMEGYIEAKFTQETTLEFIVDDAIRVYINDEPVLDGWDYHSDEIISCTFDTVAGQKYKIRIEYADFIYGATCIMRWYGPHNEMETVPTKYLYLPSSADADL